MKTQVIIHQEKIKELIQEYVENQCHGAFEIGYSDRKDKIECYNWHNLMVLEEGLIFSLKVEQPVIEE